MPTSQLITAVENLNYSCESNIDEVRPSQPGTAIIWMKDLPVQQVQSLETCRLQSITIGDQTFLNIYAPSGSANKAERNLLFSREMFPHLLSLQADLLPVLAGDWNCILAEQITTANFREKFSKDLDNLVKTFKYSDSFRTLHPTSREFTFYRASCSPARLDRIYVPPHLLASLLSVSHHPEVADHWSVHLDLNIEVENLQHPPKKINTYWKLNNTILQHESFLPQLTAVFKEMEEEIGSFPDIADWWDEYAKPGCVSFCRSFSVLLAKQRKSYKKFLYALIKITTRNQNWKSCSNKRKTQVSYSV